MNANELITNLIETYFAELKGHINIILIVFFILTVVSQIIQTIYVTKTVERFKNKLKKAEIKFSKFNQLQIESLAKIMNELSDFVLFSINITDIKSSQKSVEYKKESLSEWQSSFNTIYQSILREKFLFPKQVKNEVSDLAVYAVELMEATKIYYKYYDYYFTDQSGEAIYEYDEFFNVAKKDYTETDLKTIAEKTVESIKRTRDVIEDYFETME
ncbi:hypothetical protein [Flagellimonas crocea]|uniref:hypothetical protein n=1 Tax=Flagellimonas crocea TaxID=3067311 RepID=UPI00296EF051|nr:hypothetical protein [Muricauda sp. DH64]